MKLVLVGPPGCGKGTQAVLIREEFKVPQVSTGDILRGAVRDGTPLGVEADKYMSTGSLVPDELIINLMGERMTADDCQNGYILDGFPRTVAQAEALEKLLGETGQKLDAVVSIEVDDNEVVKRLAGRRQCKKCGDGYHVTFKQPKSEGMCDRCGGDLYQRDDDSEGTVRSRLEVYRNQTAPLLDFYQQRDLLKSVNGLGSIDDIFKDIRSLISNATPDA